MRIPNEQGNEGKYDPESEAVMALTKAKLVAVIVLRGDKGTGFSVSTVDPRMVEQLPDLLEAVAKNIRASFKKAKLS